MVVVDIPRQLKNQVSLLGVTQQIHPNRGQSPILAMADSYWGTTDPVASKTISERGAKDLVGEALHHPAMDEIPGIEHIRATFDPEKQVSLVDWLPKDQLGHLESGVSGRQLMRLGQTSDLPLKTHAVTHETAHLLTHPLLSPFQWANIDRSGSIGHSWAMARTHIHTVRSVLGDEAADNLRRIYQAHGVSFGRKNI